MLSAILVTGASFACRQEKIKSLVRKIFEPQEVVSADVVSWSIKELREGAKKRKESIVALVKQQIQWLSLSPTNPLGVKVWLIYQAQLLTIPAENALLKTLEEPLEGRYIILETEKEAQLLPTLISRLEVISLTEDKDTHTKGWSWLKKNLILPYPKLRLLAERLALEDKEKIQLFLQESQKGLFDDSRWARSKEAFQLLSFTLRGLNHNLNPKHLLIHLFWGLKRIRNT